MADERTCVSGLTFGLGLVAGTAIGAGFALLLAPKSGAALRRDMARTARRIQDDASELADRGRDVAQRATAAVATGIREATRYAADA